MTIRGLGLGLEEGDGTDSTQALIIETLGHGLGTVGVDLGEDFGNALGEKPRH